MGRPRHTPTESMRRHVEALAGYGIPESEIAGLVGIDPKTLRRHYRRELDHGHTKANAKVAENLFRKATGDGREAVTAAIFWLKTRARWKETQINEVSHEGGPQMGDAIAGLMARIAASGHRIDDAGTGPLRIGEHSQVATPTTSPRCSLDPSEEDHSR